MAQEIQIVIYNGMYDKNEIEMSCEACYNKNSKFAINL